MKKFAFACALLVSTSAFGCSFDSSDSAHVRDVVKAHGGYPISDEQCAFLNKKGLALYVSGQSTVLKGVAVAWAEIAVRDLKTGVISDATRRSTYVNPAEPSQDFANDLLYKAITDAISGFEFEVGADEVGKYMGKVKSRK
jgi:hypothetical protein